MLSGCFPVDDSTSRSSLSRSHTRQRYAVQLRQLRDMGFADEELNIQSEWVAG
jgi:hypothetical protein